MNELFTLILATLLLTSVYIDLAHSKTQCVLENSQQTFDQVYEEQIVCNNIKHLRQIEDDAAVNWKALKIVNNNHQQFYMDDESIQLTSLEKLDLSEAGELVVNDGGLKSFPNLESLNISGCKIESLEEIHFGTENTLTHLDVSWNSLEKLSLGGNDKLIVLENGNFSHNSIKRVINGTELMFPSLINLYMDSNELQSVNFHNYGKLKLLSLSDNQIKKLTLGSLSSLPSLEQLIITINPLFSIDDGALASLAKLKYLNLSDNNIKRLSANGFIGLECLRVLDISLNGLENLSPGQFTHLKKLQYLDISRNSLTTLKPLMFSDLIFLQNLNVSDNNLVGIQANTFANLRNLVTLDLSSNAIEYIGKDVFGTNSLQRFKQLSLNSNSIKHLHPMAFASLPSLQYLSLEDNAISALDVRIYERLHQLEKLNLGRNDLKTIPSNVLESLTNLKEFFIDNNRLTFLPEINITFSRLHKASLEGNPWQCLCLEQVLDWLEKRHIDYVPKGSPYFNGKKPLCVVTPVEFCVRDFNIVKEYPIEDIFTTDYRWI